MVFERELDRRKALLDIAHYCTEIAPTDVEAHVDATRVVFARYEVWGRQDAHVGHIPQVHRAAVGRADEQIADTAQAIARPGRTPHHHIVHFSVPVNVTDFGARYQCGRRPAHIARFESIVLGLGEVHLDLHLWLLDLELRMDISGTVDLREGPSHLFGLAAEDAQVGAVDADNDIVA